MAMMDKASQLDGSELTPFQVGAVDNDRCTSLQEEKWRNLPFLQNWKPTDCFFDDEAEEDLVAVFDLNYALNWVWFMQYNIFGLLQFSLFVNLVGYPLAMAGDKVVSGAEFDWHDYARWLLGSILPFAQGYFFCHFALSYVSTLSQRCARRVSSDERLHYRMAAASSHFSGFAFYACCCHSGWHQVCQRKAIIYLFLAIQSPE